jgi:hypothetical protein
MTGEAISAVQFALILMGNAAQSDLLADNA